MKPRRLLRALGTRFRYGLFSGAFLLSALGCTAALWIAALEQLPQILQTLKPEGFPPGTEESLCRVAVSSDLFSFVLPMLSAIPQSSSLYTERESGFLRSWIPRFGIRGRRRYLAEKWFCCGFAGGAAPVAGFFLFRGTLPYLLHPVARGAEQGAGDASAFLTGMLLFCFGAFCAEAGMTAALWFRQREVTVLAPFLLCFLPGMVQKRYFPGLPALDPGTWIAPDPGQWIGGESGPVWLLLLLTTGIGCLFCRIAKRRVSSL